MLTGADLLAKVKELGDVSKSDIVRACGYVSTKKDGSERVMKCTLQEGVVVPHEKTTDRVKEQKDDILPVWDLEANAWRSITIPNIKTVEFIVP